MWGISGYKHCTHTTLNIQWTTTTKYSSKYYRAFQVLALYEINKENVQKISKDSKKHKKIFVLSLKCVSLG